MSSMIMCMVRTIEIKINPELNSATYVSDCTRLTFEREYGFKAKYPQEPYIPFSYTIIPDDLEIKALNNRLEEAGLKKEQRDKIILHIKEETTKTSFIPVTYLLNKKNGDIISSHKNIKFIYCNTVECKFDDYVNTCMQQFQKNPQVDGFAKSEIKKLSKIGIPIDNLIMQGKREAEQKRIIIVNNNGTIDHGTNGWFTSKPKKQTEI